MSGPDDPTGTATDGPAHEWPVHDTVVVWETPFFEAGYDLVERPDGERARYYWLDPADAVVVVAVTDDGEVVLVEQYRPRTQGRFVECPAGLVEPDEDPVTAARRELREETGYEAGEVELLGSHHPSGWTRYARHVVVATDLAPGGTDPDDGEFLRLRTESPATALSRLERSADGGPVQGSLATPLLWAREAGHL